MHRPYRSLYIVTHSSSNTDDGAASRSKQSVLTGQPRVDGDFTVRKWHPSLHQSLLVSCASGAKPKQRRSETKRAEAKRASAATAGPGLGPAATAGPDEK